MKAKDEWIKWTAVCSDESMARVKKVVNAIRRNESCKNAVIIAIFTGMHQMQK